MEKYIIYYLNSQSIALVDIQRNDKNLSIDANTCMLFLNANFF